MTPDAMHVYPNTRYPVFADHTFFTAGDYQQFITRINDAREGLCPPMTPPNLIKGEKTGDSPSALFNHPRWTWAKYGAPVDALSTFEYIFHKFKKGIYVQIRSNRVHLFLPFSNMDYTNEWSDALTHTFASVEDMYMYICEHEGRAYVPHKVMWFPERWYCNNGLVRYEQPLRENESGIEALHDMLVTVCASRIVDDCDFFLNKRDFPLLSLHGYEPYDALVGDHVPLKSHAYDQYTPMMGMCTSDDHADLPLPTWEDWARVKYITTGQTFPKSHSTYDHDFCTAWDDKVSKIVFRGASTGLGTTTSTNPRLFFASLARTDKYTSITDIGITKWNMRPRKARPQDPLQCPSVDTSWTVPSLTPSEQSRYKYILHLPGHSCAYRLSYELAMRSVIFLFPSKYTLWFFPLLTPYVHYIPLDKGYDTEELYDKWVWCEQHPEKAHAIAENAHAFYTQYLTYENILTYVQTALNRVACFPKRTYTDLTPSLRSLRRHLVTPRRHHDDDDDERTTRRVGKTITMVDGWVMKRGSRDMCEHSHFVAEVLWHDVREYTPSFHHFQRSEWYTDDGVMATQTSVSPYTKRPPITLFDAIRRLVITLDEWKKVALQISLVLEIAQRRTGFVHYDLTPWNILVYDHDGSPLEYIYEEGTVVLTKCRFVAQIIDMEYAHVMYNDHHVHNITPFFLSREHDMCTFLFHSFALLLKHMTLPRHEWQWIAQTIRKTNVSVRDIKQYLGDEKKFSRLLLTNESYSTLSSSSPRLCMTSFLAPLRKYMSRPRSRHMNDWTFADLRPPRYQETHSHVFENTRENDDDRARLRMMYAFQKHVEGIEARIGKEFCVYDKSAEIEDLKRRYMKIHITYPRSAPSNGLFVDEGRTPYRWMTMVSESPTTRDILPHKGSREREHYACMARYLASRGYGIIITS
jgi:hypothetical protein